MKKSDFTVSMPISAYNEYECYKRKYGELVERLRDCFDDSLFNAGAQMTIDFDVKKALAICKDFIPYSMTDLEVEVRL